MEHEASLVIWHGACSAVSLTLISEQKTELSKVKSTRNQCGLKKKIQHCRRGAIIDFVAVFGNKVAFTRQHRNTASLFCSNKKPRRVYHLFKELKASWFWGYFDSNDKRQRERLDRNHRFTSKTPNVDFRQDSKIDPSIAGTDRMTDVSKLVIWSRVEYIQIDKHVR